MHWLVGWSWIGAALFGVLIAATDPVSVIAAFREMGCQPRVSMVVESESLLNDGVAAVGFAVLSAIAAGASPTLGSVVPAFLWTLGGGVADRPAVSARDPARRRPHRDPLVEITLTTIAAYGSFLIAEHVHASGIISTLTAGLMVGNIGWDAVRVRGGPRPSRTAAWEYFAFLANSFVFILIGMNVAQQPLDALGIGSDAAVAILLVLAGRALVDLSARRRCSVVRAGACRDPTSTPCSGAACAARSLSPWRSRFRQSFPERGAIILIAFVVVAFSILVQGLTMPLLIKRSAPRPAGSRRKPAVAAPARAVLAAAGEPASRTPQNCRHSAPSGSRG